MATYYARKAGSINAADVWATTPTGTASNLFPTFTNADVLMANSFTITVNVSTTVAEVRNDTTTGATLGGTFTLGFGVLLKANVFSAYHVNGAACVTSSVSASIEGNITATTSGGGSSLLNRAVIFSGASGATLTITGNIVVPASLTNIRLVDFQGSGGQINITGNLSCNSASGTHAICLSNPIVGNTGSIIITGSVSAGNSNCIHNAASNVSVTVTGTVTGGNSGCFGILNSDNSTITVGLAAGGVGGVGVSNASTGTMRVTRAVGNAYGPGNTAGLTAAVGAANVGLGVIEIEQIEYGTFGQSPVSGTGIRLKKANSNVAIFNFCDTAGAKTLIDATANAAMPAATNVRSGVSYASGALTGTCAVPAASSVGFGVPVDATTGTAVLDPAAVASAVWGAATRTLTAGGGISASDVWDYASRTLTTSSGPTAVQIRQEMDANSTKLANLDATVSSRLAPSGTLATVTTLTNAPSVPSAATIATQVRTELATELARVDAAITTRATPANIPAADITAIKAKTDALVTDRLANVATTNIVGTLLAQANS